MRVREHESVVWLSAQGGQACQYRGAVRLGAGFEAGKLQDIAYLAAMPT